MPMQYAITHIASLINAHIIGSAEGSITTLLTDSRSLCFPEESLFFALVSKHGDGHRYISELYTRGVRHYVVSAAPTTEQLAAMPDATFLIVSDTLVALQHLGAAHRATFNIPVVGITGSNGKTVVKEWLSQLLAPTYSVTRSPRRVSLEINIGADLGV